MKLGIGQSELPWGAAGAAPADVARTCQEIAALGATSIRMSAVWGIVEPTRNHKYKLDSLRTAVSAAEAVGLDILLILEPRRSSVLQMFGVPVGISATEKNAIDYGLFCGAIAQEFGDRIRYWEIGNEVNNLGYFGAPKEPAEYLEFVREAHDNIMPYAPSATILAGALMAVVTDWPTLHPVEWVTAWYDANPQGYYHGLSIHNYSTDGSFNPLVPTPDGEFAFKNIELIRAIMDKNGDGPTGDDRELYCTEWGYDSLRSITGLSTTDAELEAEQAANIQTHWDILSTYAAAGVIHETTWLYNGRDQTAKDDYTLRYGFERSDYTRKAAYTTVSGFAVWPGVVTDSIGVTDSATFDLMPAGDLIPGTDEVGVTDTATFTLSSPTPAYVSKGAGGRDTSGLNDVTITSTHVIGSLAKAALLWDYGLSHLNSKTWTLYDILEVESSIDGPLTRLASRHIAGSTAQRGSLHIFGLVDPANPSQFVTPSAGTHTISARVMESDGVTVFNASAGNSVLYQNVSSWRNVTANGSSTGGNTPDIVGNSAVGDICHAFFCGNNDFSTAFNQTVRHHAGSTVPGNGDYIMGGDAPGASAPDFTAAIGITLFGGLTIDLVP